MDVKSLISCNSSAFMETPFGFLKGLFKDNSSNSLGRNYKQDALDAVKMDPAVLEAQVTVHSNDRPASPNVRSETPVENKKCNSIKTNIEDTVPVLSPVPSPSQGRKGFKEMVLQHEAALLSLTPHQLELLMKYADVLRRQRMISQRYLECAFCKNNGKPSVWYTSHALRDVRGRVRCPILRGFHCPRCGATGDEAHTIKYCPDLQSVSDTQSSCSGKSSP